MSANFASWFDAKSPASFSAKQLQVRSTSSGLAILLMKVLRSDVIVLLSSSSIAAFNAANFSWGEP